MNARLAAWCILLATSVACSPAADPATPNPDATGGSVGATLIPSPIGSTQPSDMIVPWVAYQKDGIRLVHPDGSQDHALPAAPADAQHPDWSPDGEWLTFVADEDDSRDIWIARVDGSGLRRVVDCEAPCVDADGPAFSPDGKSIAYRVFRHIDGAFPGSRLEIVDVATGDTRLILETKEPEYIGNGTPIRWSPDGRSLVMDVSTIENPGIDGQELVTATYLAVVSLDHATPKLERIVDLPALPSYPDWHPDGGSIIFQAQAPVGSGPGAGALNLFTVQPDGAGVRQLTQLGAGHTVWGPTWAPDGLSIWAQLLQPTYTVVTLRADGTGIQVLAGPILGSHAREQPTPG